MPDPDRQTVAFYNLENFFDTVDDPAKNDNDFLPGSYKNWSEQRYLEKLENITSSISSIDQNSVPAIIGVAEIENKTVLTDLIYQPGISFMSKVHLTEMISSTSLLITGHPAGREPGKRCQNVSLRHRFFPTKHETYCRPTPGPRLSSWAILMIYP